MIRINLLPHRAEKRRARQIQFAALGVISVVLGALLVGFVHGYISNRISYQERRNEYLKQETAKLDKQIAEIKKLREETQSLLERKTVVENLQSTRSDVVHLLDQMLRILPEGVSLKTLRQTGNKIHITGYAQTNARISTLMRAVENSPWLNSPSLGVIQASSANGARVSEFTLTFNLVQTKDAAAAGLAKPAGAKG
ncbi:MAG: PilN domain-containing protein [Gallionella sp.]|nr:PilN domain-containing protein [Gallionella sp.]